MKVMLILTLVEKVSISVTVYYDGDLSFSHKLYPSSFLMILVVSCFDQIKNSSANVLYKLNSQLFFRLFFLFASVVN